MYDVGLSFWKLTIVIVVFIKKIHCYIFIFYLLNEAQ